MSERENLIAYGLPDSAADAVMELPAAHREAIEDLLGSVHFDRLQSKSLQILSDAIREAARKISEREAGAVDDAIAALLAAGVGIDDIEVLVSQGGGETVVRKRRGPPLQVGDHSGYYP